ncbi:MAG: glycosyltransferase family 39 protein [Bacteroidales bacterium]|nr:glycosyltransferase family 39 protein [Bacteroidales bacterium]
MKNSRLHQLIIIILAVLCYGNTLTLKYALDDRMMLMESQPVIQGGWEGIRYIFTQDSFNGYFGNEGSLVAGGRYRPMSQLTFMIEFQFFGQKIKKEIGDYTDYYNLHDPQHEELFNHSILPVVSHLMNILYFTLLCLLVYQVLVMLFGKLEGKKWYQSLAFLATILFVMHPIHTEAVANVKGRDEIFAMLGAMAALWCSLKYVQKHQWWYLLLSLLAITFALFSKENAITFLAVIPLALWYYNVDTKRKSDYVVTLIPILIGSIFFIAIRSMVLGGIMPEDSTHNILNNPFVNSTKAEEIATVLITWGIYLKLLIFPHPLTHDYYPFQVEVTNFANPLVWLIALAVIAILIYALIKLKKKDLIAFGILFFVITFSITSNLLFNLGTLMNERFVFIPSLGFTLVLGYFFYWLFTSKADMVRKGGIALFTLVALFYGIKTFTRNFVWHDDFSLFLTDVKTSENSIKCNISAGGSYLQIWKKSHKERDKKMAYQYLYKAMELQKTALNAHLLMGELMFLDNNLEGSLQFYQNAAAIDPSNKMAQDNIVKVQQALKGSELDKYNTLIAEAERDRVEGRTQDAITKLTIVQNALEKQLKENPNNIVALNVMGNLMGRGYGNFKRAMDYYNQVLKMDPKYASTWENMGIIYAIQKDFTNAERCLKTALSISPDNDNIKTNLRLLYTDMGKPELAKQYE